MDPDFSRLRFAFSFSFSSISRNLLNLAYIWGSTETGPSSGEVIVPWLSMDVVLSVALSASILLLREAAEVDGVGGDDEDMALFIIESRKNVPV